MPWRQCGLWEPVRQCTVEEDGVVQFVDLFSGIGGATQGAREAGLRPVLAVDDCEHACRVYAQNHPEVTQICATLPLEGDAPLPLPRSPTDAGVARWHLHGSPPCTKLSKANQQREAGARADALALVRWFLDLALHSSASSWSMEQVYTPALARLLTATRARSAWHRARLDFVVVNMATLGLPTYRKRILAGSPRFVAAVRRLQPRKRTIRDVLPLVGGTHVRHEVVWSTPLPIDDSVGDAALPRTHVRTQFSTKYAYRHYGPDELCRPIDAIAPCITARHPLRWATPGTNTPLRRMSPRETALLQSFPANYALDTHVQRANRGIGNAMPPYIMRRALEELGH